MLEASLMHKMQGSFGVSHIDAWCRWDSAAHASSLRFRSSETTIWPLLCCRISVRTASHSSCCSRRCTDSLLTGTQGCMSRTWSACRWATAHCQCGLQCQAAVPHADPHHMPCRSASRLPCLVMPQRERPWQMLSSCSVSPMQCVVTAWHVHALPVP